MYMSLIIIIFDMFQQAGPHPWAIENFAMVAKYPSAQIFSQVRFRKKKELLSI